MSDFARTLALTVAGVLILLVSLWYGRHLLLLVFGGVHFAVSLRGISDRLGDAARVDRRLALWLVVSAGLVGASVVAEPYLVADQVQTLAARLQPAFDRLRELVERSALGCQLGRTLPSEVPDLSTTVAQASPVVGAVAGVLFDVAVVTSRSCSSSGSTSPPSRRPASAGSSASLPTIGRSRYERGSTGSAARPRSGCRPVCWRWRCSASGRAFRRGRSGCPWPRCSASSPG